MDWKPGATMKELKVAAIREALKRNNGNRTYAARELDISIRTLRNYLAEFPDLEKPAPADPAGGLNGEP